MKKTFDCVEMKRRGAERIYAQVKDLTPEQELAFWQQRTEEFRSTFTRAKTTAARGTKSGAKRVRESFG